MYLSHAFKHTQFLDALAGNSAIFLAQAHFHAILEHATVHTPHCNAPHIGIIVKRCYEHLRVTLHHLWSWNVLNDCIKHCGDVVGGLAPVVTHPAILGTAKNGRKVELVLGSIEVEHQVKDSLLNLVGAAVGLIHLVDNNNRLEAYLDCLLQYKASLRHWPLKSIHE